MSHNVPNELPGDLGAHDPRRMTHPDQNQPGSGGHEVKLGSNEAKGVEGGASAAEHSRDGNPRSDNTAAHALEGGSTETMDRAKRQHNSDITGGRTGHDSYEDAQTRGGLQQESTRGSGYDNSSSIRGPGQEHNYTREQELGGVGSGLTGSHTGHHHGSHTGSGLTGSTGTGLTGSHTGHHTGSNTGLTGGLTGNQSGTEPVSGLRGSGVAGEPYDAGNVQSSGFGGSDPQTRHQLHHGDPHHQHDFSHQHTTRTGELLDPASGRDTGIPGYAGQGASGLTGSSTGTGLTGSSTGTGLTGSHTGHHTSHTGTGEGILREGERAVGAGGAGYGSSTGSGLTGSNTHGTHGTSGLTGSHGTSGVTGSHTGTGYGQSTGDRLREDVREGERAIGSGNTTHGSTGSGLTGSHTGSGVTGSHTTGTGHNTSSTGERLREDVREGEQYATGRDTTGSHTTGSHTTGSHTTGTDTTGTDTTAKKPSLMDRLNPLKDADHDGKKGFMD